MCGICGFVSQDDEETLARMTAVLLHRGPDDSGLYLSQPTADGLRAGLGNRRLAILDLSAAGHMPMSDPERTLWITYNGEIYNYPQLRKELEAKGYRFRSKSDTEAIVYLYQSEGPEFVRPSMGCSPSRSGTNAAHSSFSLATISVLSPFITFTNRIGLPSHPK